jgi:hypothetical protein
VCSRAATKFTCPILAPLRHPMLSIHLRRARSIFSNALNFCHSAIAALVRPPCLYRPLRSPDMQRAGAPPCPDDLESGRLPALVLWRRQQAVEADARFFPPGTTLYNEEGDVFRIDTRLPSRWAIRRYASRFSGWRKGRWNAPNSATLNFAMRIPWTRLCVFAPCKPRLVENFECE